MRRPAAIYTYSKSKGLFAGISIEGSALIERKDANRKCDLQLLNPIHRSVVVNVLLLSLRFYGRDDIRAFHMLGGAVDPPEECKDLYQVSSF